MTNSYKIKTINTAFMGSELRRKFIVLSLTVIFASGFVAAQISNGGAGGTPSITGFLDDIAMGVNDAISWDTGDNWESMLLYVILPALGVYAAARFVIGKGFHYAEANFQERSSLGSSELGDTAEWAAKILSAITAIWAVVAWGAFIAAYWYLAGLVFMIFLLWILVTGGIGVMSPFPELGLAGGNNAANGDNLDPEVEREINEIADQNQTLRDELEQVRNQEESDEERINSGDEGPEEAESHIRTELKELSKIEEQIAEIEKEVETVESQIKSQEQSTEQEEQHEQKLLQRLEAQQKKFAEALKDIGAYEEKTIENQNGIDEMLGGLKHSDQVDVNALEESIGYNFQNLQNIQSMLDSLFEMEQQEFKELQTALEEEKDVLSNLEAQKQEIVALEDQVKQLFEDIDILESCFEAEEDIISQTERLAQQVEDREDYQKLQEDEKIIENLEDKFNSVLNEEHKIRERIEELKEIEEHERSQHQQIIIELQEMEQSFDNTRQLLTQIGENMEGFLQDLRLDKDEIQRVLSSTRENLDDPEMKSKYEDAQRTYTSNRGGGDWSEINREFEQTLMATRSILDRLTGENSNQGMIQTMEEMEQYLGSYLSDIKG